MEPLFMVAPDDRSCPLTLMLPVLVMPAKPPTGAAPKVVIVPVFVRVPEAA